MIEAVNKIIKYNYLFKEEINNYDHLVSYLKKFIPNYNDRYHGSLGGLSPNEAYTGKTYDKTALIRRMARAHKERLDSNRKYKCTNH